MALILNFILCPLLFMIFSSINVNCICFERLFLVYKCTNTTQEDLFYDLQEKYVKREEEEDRHPHLYQLEVTNSKLLEIYSFSVPMKGWNDRLQNLTMVNSAISFINENAFKQLSSLSTLILSDNNLGDISFVATLPPKIDALILSGNRFEIVTDVFCNLENLKYLDLSNCKIRNIVNLNIFNSIGTLNLNGNDFVAFNLYIKVKPLTFATVVRWEDYSYKNEFRLDLSSNRIKQFDIIIPASFDQYSLNLAYNSIIDLKSLTALHDSKLPCINLDLSFNNFSRYANLDGHELFSVEKLVITNSNIQDISIIDNFNIKNSLDFSNNRIDVLSSNSFSSLELPLECLNISNSTINRIEENAFNAIIITESCNLSLNHIKVLRNYTFNNTQIKILDLSFSEIEKIENEAFFDANISVLILNNNKITYLIKSTFNPLSSVTEIDLSFNPLKKFNNDLFTKCDSLYLLNLSNTRLEVVRSKAFNTAKNLRVLYLQNNYLRNISIESATLNIIDLRNNSIFAWDSRNLNIKALDKLILNNNELTILTNNSFYNISALIELDLSATSIYVISISAFRGLNRLQILNLSSNFITEIGPKIFHDLVNLSQLDLSNNPIKLLSRFAFNYGNKLDRLKISFHGVLFSNSFITLHFVKQLNIVNSNISVIERNSFKGLMSMSEIKFSNTTVSKINPGALIGLIALRDLSLDVLFAKIDQIETGMFQGLTSIEILNVSSLGIASIATGSFKGVLNLKTLLLDRNQIKLIPFKAFSNRLDNLLVLSLSFNYIEKIDDEAFSSLISLRELYLNNNAITDISLNTFQYVLNLSILNLANNLLHIILAGAFSNLHLLKSLDLSNNNISNIGLDVLFPLKNLEYLDLTHNHLMEIDHGSILKSLSNLRFVGLNRNKWKCTSLALMLMDFKKYNVEWMPADDLVHHSENIDGIECVDVCKFLYCDSNLNLL